MANEYVRKRMVLNNFKQNSPLILIRGLFLYLERAHNIHLLTKLSFMVN